MEAALDEFFVMLATEKEEERRATQLLLLELLTELAMPASR